MRQGLDDDTLRFLEVVAGRAIDGLQLYAKLAELRKSAGLAALFTEPPFNQVRSEDRPRVVQAMTAWLNRHETLFAQSNDKPSWVRERLEYSFAVSGQTSTGETVLNAPEYLEGHLDWFSFVVDPTATLGAIGQISSVTSTFLPTPVSFRGMPSRACGSLKTPKSTLAEWKRTLTIWRDRCLLSSLWCMATTGSCYQSIWKALPCAGSDH
jgi:hypothetical protein